MPLDDLPSSHIQYTNTRCIARFFPFKKRETLDSDDTESAMDADELIEDNSIVGCSIFRDKSSPSGSFQLTLKPDKNYYNLVKPGDWVIIYLDNIDEIDIKNLKGVKFIGVIERIARNRVTLNDGSVINSFSINGAEWASVLINTEIFYNPYAPQPVLDYIIQQLGFKLEGSPLNFVNKIIDIFLGNGPDAGADVTLFLELIPPKLFTALKGSSRSKGGPVCFNDIMIRDFDDDTDEGYSTARNLAQVMNGSLWNGIQQFQNKMVNEIFTDIRDGQPHLIFRKMPLSKDLVKHIKDEGIIEVSEKNILNYNLGTSSHEVYNFLSIYPNDILFKDSIYYSVANFLPYVAKDSTKRFGCRRADFDTDYGMDKPGTNPNLTTIRKWADELKEYWFNYYHLENGTIEIRGLYAFNLGRFIKIQEQKKIYLVNSINIDWNYGDSPITSLTVTMGQNEDGSYIDQDKDQEIQSGLTIFKRPLDVDFSGSK